MKNNTVYGIRGIFNNCVALRIELTGPRVLKLELPFLSKEKISRVRPIGAPKENISSQPLKQSTVKPI